MTETWLGIDSFFNPKITGYDFISGKLDKKVGGVGIFIKQNISYRLLNKYHI